MDIMGLLIQAVSGAVGGNLGGMINKAKSLGLPMNTILGALGGLGGNLALGDTMTNLVGNGTAGTAAASGLVGLLLPMLGGFLKNKEK